MFAQNITKGIRSRSFFNSSEADFAPLNANPSKPVLHAFKTSCASSKVNDGTDFTNWTGNE
jgi:hypothetical protein|tara:strand:+ start:599 stop:781 length:183 start_codon:yes stop_codon:yes gene_type:complete